MFSSTSCRTFRLSFDIRTSIRRKTGAKFETHKSNFDITFKTLGLNIYIFIFKPHRIIRLGSHERQKLEDIRVL